MNESATGDPSASNTPPHRLNPLPTLRRTHRPGQPKSLDYIEAETGWSIKKFVRTTRRYRSVKIKAGNQILTAADPLPDDLRDALIRIHANGAH